MTIKDRIPNSLNLKFSSIKWSVLLITSQKYQCQISSVWCSNPLPSKGTSNLDSMHFLPPPRAICCREAFTMSCRVLITFTACWQHCCSVAVTLPGKPSCVTEPSCGMRSLICFSCCWSTSVAFTTYWLSKPISPVSCPACKNAMNIPKTLHHNSNSQYNSQDTKCYHNSITLLKLRDFSFLSFFWNKTHSLKNCAVSPSSITREPD